MTELVQRDIHWARKITERLRLQATNYQEARDKISATIKEAQEGNAAGLLGYASWTAYASDVLGDQPLRLERDERRELVAELSEAGMSTRAIAPIVGASQRTVADDVSNSAHLPKRESSGFYDAGEEIASNTISTADIEADADTGEVIEPEPERKITGMDGKQYTRPEPKKPKAEAVTSRFSSAVTDLNRLLDRFHRISGDDGFRRNTETINTLHHADITRAINELQNLADALNK